MKVEKGGYMCDHDEVAHSRDSSDDGGMYTITHLP